jgi:hypothetical protein
MEAASTSEMSVKFYQTTWPNNPEDSHLHTRRRENLWVPNVVLLKKEKKYFSFKQWWNEGSMDLNETPNWINLFVHKLSYILHNLHEFHSNPFSPFCF